MMSAVLCLALAAGEPAHATLTVPLPDALKLLGPSPKEDAAPPVSAAVVSQRLLGRVGPDAVEVTASFTVTVLDGARWSRLSLLRLAPGVTLVDAPHVEGGLVAVQGHEVVLVSRSVGTSTVELKLSARSSGAPVKSAQLCHGADALDGLMKAEADGELDVLEHGALVASEAGCWTVRWRSQTRPKATLVVARPPLEPTVARASAQVVSTMEGKARLTLQYELELDREQPLSLELPEGWSLARLSINDVPQRAVAQGRLALTVGPSRAGERTGRVTVTLERDFGVFHLSGRLNLELPKVSWATKVVDLSAHLPVVFEYHRAGGSLEPVESSEAPAADDGLAPMETPGKRLSFRQYLVTAVGPTLELKYSVDLDHRYFSLKGHR
jgi:hypothetical protein